jgi:hypothetical protein
MNEVIQWLKENTEFDSVNNRYFDEGGYCDSTVFEIEGDIINRIYSSEYGDYEHDEMTVEQFVQEYMS